MPAVKTRTRKARLSPLQKWAEENVLAPARKIFQETPNGCDIECIWCEGTGEDEFFRGEDCQSCEGDGVQFVGVPPDEWRETIDRKLRAAGLNPAAFDDDGNLIREFDTRSELPHWTINPAPVER